MNKKDRDRMNLELRERVLQGSKEPTGTDLANHAATLEDVCAVLDAAGYLVAKKADFKFDVRPFSFEQSPLGKL